MSMLDFHRRLSESEYRSVPRRSRRRRYVRPFVLCSLSPHAWVTYQVDSIYPLLAYIHASENLGSQEYHC
jgi:hypothetical protein